MRKYILIRRMKYSSWGQLLRALLAGIVVVTLVIVGLIFRYGEIGKYLILGYAILALVLRIKSDTTFKMVLTILVCMPVLSVRGDDELIATLSMYAFLLLGVGIAGLFLEHISSGKKYI